MTMGVGWLAFGHHQAALYATLPSSYTHNTLSVVSVLAGGWQSIGVAWCGLLSPHHHHTLMRASTSSFPAQLTLPSLATNPQRQAAAQPKQSHDVHGNRLERRPWSRWW